MVNKKNLSRHFLSIVLIIFFLGLTVTPMIPMANASGVDADFDSIVVKAVPPIQGVGGEVRIIATAKFYGGCCYHLYAHDVEAKLSAPNNLTIVSSLPGKIDEIDAVPGGSPTTKDFKWVLVSDGPGTFEISITITTSNCGTKTGTCQVSIVQKPSVSNPTTFPNKPSVGETITFSAEALSGSTFIDVETTTLYIWGSTKDYDPEDLFADGNSLFKITDNQESNTTTNKENITKKFLGTGKMYPMSSDGFTNTWRIQVNDLTKEENIYYWFNVETSDGRNITTFITQQPIEDLEKKYMMLDAMIWGSFFVIVLGIILILGISWAYLNKPAGKIDKGSIFVLGSSQFTKPSEGMRANVSTFSLAKFRMILFWIFVALTIVTLVYSIYSGLFQDLIIETGG